MALNLFRPGRDPWISRPERPPRFKWMEQAMTKSKTIAAALAALTLAASLTVTSGQAQAHPKFDQGLGIGLAVGTAIGVAAASHRYVEPVYIDGECR